MSWNYRIMAKRCPEHNETVYTIREVYYNKAGIADGFTDPIDVASMDGLNGIKLVLKEMIKATEKPILSEDNFPEEFKED